MSGLGAGVGGIGSSSYESSVGGGVGGVADAMFAAADVNNDGQLSRAEFRNLGY